MAFQVNSEMKKKKKQIAKSPLTVFLKRYLLETSLHPPKYPSFLALHTFLQLKHDHPEFSFKDFSLQSTVQVDRSHLRCP
jgi:hypothetical protein